MTSRMKDLRDFVAVVETFVREKCSSQESGAATSEPSCTQGHQEVSVSNRAMQSASSAGASGSIAGTPAYIQAPEPPTIAPPSVPTGTSHFSTIQSDVRAGAIQTTWHRDESHFATLQFVGPDSVSIPSGPSVRCCWI